MKTKIQELTASEITESALTELRWRGFEVWRQNNIRVRGRIFTGKLGLSDIQGYHKLIGQALYCEVKKIGDTLSQDQIDFLTAAKKAGCDCRIATQDKTTGNFLLKEFEIKKV